MSALLTAVAIAASAAPADCERTYTRAHFHDAARSTYRTAFPPARKVRTLDRVQRCQRYASSRPIVREHRRRYRHAWRVRFYFEHAWARVPAWAKSYLYGVGACETRGYSYAASYTVDTGNSFYGRYQFTWGTFRSVGGSGNPAAAPPREQDVRAYRLYLRDGSAPWPVCG